MDLSKKIFSILVAVVLTACMDKTAETRISVSAKRIDGSAIAEASIYLGNERIGETNAFGTFKDSVKLQVGQRYEIKIKHDDATYYYSPHSETFQVREDYQNEVTINTTMYLAPKPKKISVADTKPSANSIVDRGPSAPLNGASNIVSWNLRLIPIESDFFHVDRSLTEDEKKPYETSDIFTVHVHNGTAPVEDADVSWTEDISKVTTCKTNPRGRCVLRKSASFHGSGSLLVRKRGYESALKTIQPQDSQSLRIKLDPGSTIDAQLLQASFQGTKALSEAQIQVENGSRFSTDKNGYVTIPQTHQKFDVSASGLVEPIRLRPPTSFDQVWTLRLVVSGDLARQNFEVLPVHSYRSSPVTIKPELLHQISEATMVASKGQMSPRGLHDLGSVSYKQKSILPVIDQGDSGLKLTLFMIDPGSDTIISEDHEHIGHSKDEMYAQIKTLFDRLNLSAPVWGLVDYADKNMVRARLDSTHAQVGGSLNIRTDTQTFEARITSRSKNTVTARIEGNIEPDFSWKIIGASAFIRGARSANVMTRSELRDRLIERNPDFYSIDVARKHLAEENPKAALLALNISDQDSLPLKIVKLNESAQAKIQLGDLWGAIRLLNEALVHAWDHRFSKPAIILESNLLFLRAQTLPTIPGDKNLITSLDDISKAVSNMMASIALQKNSDDQVVTLLQYTSLSLRQKLAMTSQDTHLLLALENEWEKFIEDLKGKRLTKGQAETLEQASRSTRQYARSDQSTKSRKQ